MDYSKVLEQLQQRLKNKSLSVLVGAGFSKNVHNKLFLSWWELLDKMVRRMNHNVYTAAFERISGIKPTEDEDKFNGFVTSEVNQYLEQTDYLQVVSDYIRKMGYRETVDVCIEENVPKAIRKEGKLFLRQSKNGVITDTEISQGDLEIHNKLIKLPWNNIYTTNYDNLLEFCIDTKVISGLEEQVKKYDEEILTLQQNIQTNSTNVADLNSQIPSKITGLKGELFMNDDETFKEKYLEINKLSYQISYDQSQIETLNRKKWELEDAIDDSYSIVRHSSELAIKRNRNIIKLHGSLPEHDNEPFAFDNEYNKRYIISGEDYEHYPVRHEAFTQLMRISLLQGCFCLIGFSGDDANFMAWISWVRTVIMRERGNDKEDTKIYFIDARATEPADSHKQQFYKNYRIVHIPLSHPSCIEFLQKKSGKSIAPTTTHDLLNELMDYLTNVAAPDLPQVSYEVMAREKYEQYWKNSKISKRSANKDDVLELCAVYYELNELKQYNSVPSFDYLNNHIKVEFILAASTIYSSLGLDDASEIKFLGTIALALEDLFLPYSCLIEDHDFKQLLKKAKSLSQDIYCRYLKLDAKDAIWKADRKKLVRATGVLMKLGSDRYASDVVTLNLMGTATMFRFREMNKILESNLNSSFNSTALAGYWMLFDRKAGLDRLKKQKYKLVQERLYAMEVMQMLLAGKQDGQLLENRQRLQQAGLRLLNDNQEYVLSLFNKQKVKIEPYESDDFLGRSFSIGNSGKKTSSLQLLGMMLEKGTHFSGKEFYFLDKDKVYPIFEEVYQQYSVPVLFFAFQYGDEKYIKRLGQDYAYSPSLSINPEQLFELLSVAYKDPFAPLRYKENTLIFLAQFIIIVKPKVWENFLLEVWNEKKDNGQVFDKDRRNNLDFIESSLRHCQNAVIMSKVLTDCLQAASENNGQIDSVNRHLFVLANNPFLKALKSRIQRNENPDYVNKLLQLLPKVPDYLFILGNIHIFLNKEQIKKLEHALLKMDYGLIKFPNLWSVITYYCKKNRKLQQKVIGELLKSPQLWRTGISLTPEGKLSWSSNSDFIKLRKLRKGGKKEVGLTFSDRDVLELYNKMKPKLEEVRKIEEKGRSVLDDFFPLLQEMSWFLDMESDKLKNELDFDQVRNSVIQLSFDGNMERHKLAGLTSDNVVEVNEAITEITVALYDRSGFEKHKPYIQLIINKIQLKRGPGLVLCLEYLVGWCKHFRGKEEFKEFKNGLLEILNLYRSNYPEGLAISKVEELLVSLAVVLSNWGCRNEDITYFIALIEKSRYNNVRFNLKEKLNQKNYIS
ncbi:hypothetical protein DCC81_25140 [Chitinophaga parva]|uniref:Uncharacterized protein n=1 Tax=Chitinophaga parva TaxID=2169414 RepID=A0A2T7BB70_9BACT|nr:SIR2 family protein [Chitinophaga parva]PUZ21297.1 hypothetical protein DCC81_25140 [Chitinophaga parva]